MNKLPFGLNQYVITMVNLLPDNRLEQRLVKARNKESAWAKFVTQYFGAMKPNPRDYVILEVIL